jgi:hypothetical protein
MRRAPPVTSADLPLSGWVAIAPSTRVNVTIGVVELLEGYRPQAVRKAVQTNPGFTSCGKTQSAQTPYRFVTGHDFSLAKNRK